MILDERFQRRFWSKVEKGSDCWEWTAGKNSEGYGRIITYPGRKVKFAHRISYLLSCGEIPDGNIVCHHCDNPSCVNPDHLFAGTDKDNSDDKIKKGRLIILCGEKSPKSKLSESDVLRILKDHRTHRAIAQDYSVTPTQIGYIKRGVNWKHLQEQAAT